MIEVSERDGVAILRMADGKANTMTTESCAELTVRLEELAAGSARAVVVTGERRMFSAGVDLLRLANGGADYVQQFLPALCTMLGAAFSFPKPLVAAINGHAIAGGCVLACAADRRLMASDAGRIGITELLVGVPFPPVAMEVMRTAVVPQYFAEAVLSGSTYTPPEAMQRGMVDEVVEPTGLIDRAVAAAGKLAALPPAVFALTKRQIRQPALDRLASGSDDVQATVDRLWASPQTFERVRDYVASTLRKS
jgi:enoyl-CoA hydratase